MKRSPAILVMLGAFGLVISVAAQTPAAKATAATSQAGDIPRMPDGHPNLNGIWDHPYVPDVTKDGRNQKGSGPLPFTDSGAENFKNYDVSKFDYTGHCLPFGLMRSVNVGGYPIQIVQYGKYIALLFEQNTWFHVVAMDRDHPKDLERTWFGDSVGKWDGDTLVIDTIGFNGRTRLDTIGHPHSDQMHLIERYKLTDPDHISYEVTVDDPKTFTKPWTNVRVFPRMPAGSELIEYSCEENNRDFTEGHIK
jgi:hypothetical protein